MQNGKQATAVATFNVEMNWNVQTFLPIAVQEKFSVAVGSFIYNLYEFKQRSALAGDLDRTPLRPVLEPNTPVQPDTSEKGKDQEALTGLAASAKFNTDLINHTMTRKLLKQVSELKNAMQTSSDEINAAIAREEDEDFPWE